MKRFIISLFIGIFIFSATTVFAQDVRTGVSMSDGHLRNFYFSISDYYRVPEPQVKYFHDRYHIADEELPVLFFLSSRTHLNPQFINDLRMRSRMSWLDITFRFGLTPEIYYVPVGRVAPPYGNAYGHYKKHENTDNRAVLADDDIVNLVNLSFMSDYYDIAPEVILDKRGKGEKFYVMNDEFSVIKGKNRNHENKKHQSNYKNSNNDQNKGGSRS